MITILCLKKILQKQVVSLLLYGFGKFIIESWREAKDRFTILKVCNLLLANMLT